MLEGADHLARPQLGTREDTRCRGWPIAKGAIRKTTTRDYEYPLLCQLSYLADGTNIIEVAGGWSSVPSRPPGWVIPQTGARDMQRIPVSPPQTTSGQAHRTDPLNANRACLPH